MDVDRKITVLLLCVVRAFLEIMMAYLVYLDQTRSSLWDTVFGDYRNPGFRCRARLSYLLSLGFGGPLGLIKRFWDLTRWPKQNGQAMYLTMIMSTKI